MSKKRKRNSQANAKNFEKILRESLDKELSCDEVKSLHASIKEYITTDAGGAEVLHKLVTKVFCNHRLKDAKRLKAIRVYDYTFLKSKDFRGIVCNRLRTSIQACCRGSADNASDISKDAVALELLLCVHRWDAAFGSIYPELRLVIRYYSESVRVLNADGVSPHLYTD